MAGLLDAATGLQLDLGPGVGDLGVDGKTAEEDCGKPTPKVPENNPACTSTGVTNCGVIKSAKWKAMLNGAILAYNTYNSLKMAKLQRDLGEKYLSIAKEQRAYYNKQYKPLEKELTKEALALPKYVRDKEQLYTGQMLMTARMQRAGKLDGILSCTGRYCTGQRAAILTEQLLEQATTESLVAGMAERYVDREELVHNKVRWDKRDQIEKIGREIPTEAISYASLAAGTFGSLGKQAGLAAEGAMSFLGYGRADTRYPERRGVMSVGSYTLTPQKVEYFKPNPPPTYKKPEEPTTTIKLRQ